jgi:hypothetical protein
LNSSSEPIEELTTGLVLLETESFLMGTSARREPAFKTDTAKGPSVGNGNLDIGVLRCGSKLNIEGETREAENMFVANDDWVA